MIKNKAYKYRLYPTKDQAQLIDRTIGCARFIYNRMLADKIEHYQNTKKSLSNTPAQYKKEFPFLSEVDSMALCNAQMNLQTAYSNFFRKLKQGKKDAGFPKFKSKHKSKWAYTTNCINGNIAISDNKLKLPKLGKVRCMQHRSIPNDCIIKSTTITKTRTGKYYASILVEYETQVSQKEIETVIGLDFSMKDLYVDSNGDSASYPRYFRQAQEELARQQRVFSHRKKGSKRYEKQRIRVAKVYEKIANQRKDFLHKASKILADKYDMVCVEDLDMKAMAQCMNFGKSVSDNGWGYFRQLLKYKLEDQGKQLFVIDKWFPSSKTCSNCGAINENLKLSDRVWICDCGVTHNRDVNAANNIRNFGIITSGLEGIAQECLPEVVGID